MIIDYTFIIFIINVTKYIVHIENVLFLFNHYLKVKTMNIRKIFNGHVETATPKCLSG